MWPGIFKQVLHTRNCKILRKKIKVESLFSTKWKKFSCGASFVQLSQKSTNIDDNSPLCNVVNSRQAEARRSILVQVQSSYSYKELYAYCNSIGKVKYMFHYSSGVEPLHFILVEFNSEDDVKNVLSTSCHIDDTQAVPTSSPFLWFRVSSSKKSLKLPKTNKLNVENGNKVPSNETIMELLKKSSNISEQMNVLYDSTKLNDLGVRLRFLTARQVELAVMGMFPKATAYPFGSSINGCGKMGCDLDLILKLDSKTNTRDSRLVYQCKEGFGNERSQSQRHMEAIGDLLQLFLPGCSQVRRILQARVPILKYNQQFTDVECDLSMTNMTAFNMSELLYLFGSLDQRVRPLVFTIRKWAQEIGLTNSSPGRWITNFSLTLLVLAFLQRSHHNFPPVLPSVNALNKLVEKTNDEKLMHCAFLIPENKLPKTTNSNSLHELLIEFFEYYSGYDFNTKAISLNEATDIIKPEYSSLYIVNPLEKGLNVSKNVSPEEMEKLRLEFRNAAWTLESDEKSTGKWGILSLFENNKSNNISRIVTSSPNKQNRLMQVSQLFEDQGLIENDEIVCKNDEVKKQVAAIKKETANTIKEINLNDKIKFRRRNVKRR